MNVVIYWLHLIGIVAWGGGIFLHVLVVMPSLQALSPPDRRRLMGAYGKRFTILTWGAVILVGVTGLLNVNRLLGFSALVSFGSSYSNILLAKIIVVAAMIVNGFYMGMILVPKIASFAPPPGATPMPSPGQGEPPPGPPPGAAPGPPPGAAPGPPPELARLQKRLSILGGVQVGLVAAVLLLLALR